MTELFTLDRPHRLRFRSDGVIFVLYLMDAKGEAIQNLHIGGAGEDEYPRGALGRKTEPPLRKHGPSQRSGDTSYSRSGQLHNKSATAGASQAYARTVLPPQASLQSRQNIALRPFDLTP
ncbi:hypothetical protein M2322_003917 [Rhodoblastus acidophilus]|uniref:hypothetical protein n=1 Tax=Rhodoblastus acidophilus TaxID=1074 RepID=UPI00222420DC|nr:hypothetical protein [Rhodoblastus acidophilus]MCW2318348.1 hypothetical protein [Rhodoblastus acidophilus]